MQAPISSNLDFDVEDEQELPKVTTRNTPILISTTSMANDLHPQPATEPNHVARSTQAGRTSKVSKNLDFETNYIDSTTAMTATESNVDKSHLPPPSSVQPVTERSASMPLHETHQMNETSTKEKDVDNADAEPPQSNAIEDSVPNSTPRPENVQPDVTPGAVEGSLPNSIDIAPEKAAEITPDLAPKSEQNEGSNTDLGPGTIEENKLESQPKPEDEAILEKTENKTVEIPSTTQENLIDVKPKTEESQEPTSVSTATNSGTDNSESEKSSVSAQPNVDTPVTPTNANEEPSSSALPPANTDEISKPESTPTVGTIEESKSEAMPESKIEETPEAQDRIDDTPKATQSSAADSDTNAIEKPSSPDQSESTKPQSEDSAVMTTASPKNEPVEAPSPSTATPTPTPTPTINEANQEESLPPKESTHTENVDAETSSSNPVNEINEIKQNVKEATQPQPTPPALSQPNTKDYTSESTNDKIIEETENASTALVSRAELILLGCLIFVSYNQQ